MLLDPAAPLSPAKPLPMGRRRTINHGLPPRMQRKGNGYYYVFPGPSRKWVALGADIAKAKRKWAELDAGAPPSLSVGDLVQKYIDREERPDSTAKQYKSYHKTIAAAFPIPASQLTSQHVALWRELNGHRRTYANGCIATVVAAARFGQELGLCNSISVEKWSQSPRDRVLAAGEFVAIRDAAMGWLQVAMDIAYLTGSRPSDIRALCWNTIAGSSLAVRQIKTKTRQEFVINEALASVLARARQRPILGLYVVATDKGQPVSRDMMSRAWIAACKAAGVADAQFRDIRAMAAKQGKADGIDYQALLGHTTKAMSERYIKGRQTVVAEPVRRKL